MMVQAATPAPMFATLSGPTLIATNEKPQYQVVAIGGPGESNGNYSFSFTVVGSSSASNALVTPDSGTSKTGRFTTNLTASSFAEDITLSVLVTSYNASATSNITKSIVVKIVKPIVISAKVVNQGNVTLTGIPVAFFVDDVKLYNTTITLSRPWPTESTRCEWSSIRTVNSLGSLPEGPSSLRRYGSVRRTARAAMPS